MFEGFDQTLSFSGDVMSKFNEFDKLLTFSINF